MSLWHEDVFYMNFKDHVVKRHQTAEMPVFHIDNSGNRQRFKTEGDQEYTEDLSKALVTRTGIKTSENDETDNSQAVNSQGAENKSNAPALSEAEAILQRINADRENKHMQDIEMAKRQAEEARFAATKDALKAEINSAAEKANASDKDEELRRAQEIIDRLNREAAEDEAKKQAELDEAKAKAAEKFGE